MKENNLIDNLEERLKAELLEEEKRILEELAADESLKNYHVTKEMDERMVERIRKEKEEREAYEKLSEKDKEALRLGREAMLLREAEAIDVGDEEKKEDDKKEVVPFRKKKKKRKVFLLVAIVAVLVLAMGMTSIGGRPFILDFVDDVLEGREVTKVDSTREGEANNLDGISEEEKFYQEVEETFGCQIVKMGYTPKRMTFLEGGIEAEVGNVYALYLYEERILEYQIVINYRKQSYGYDVEDILISEEKMEVAGIPIIIKTYELPDEKLEYVAEFKYEDAFYTINAVMKEKEFMQILQNLFFF